MLTTDYEIRRNGPSPALYFSPLLDPTPAYPGPTIAGGRETPRPHAMVGRGYTGGWSVGQSVVSNFLRYSGVQIHLGDTHSKQRAALNASSL